MGQTRRRRTASAEAGPTPRPRRLTATGHLIDSGLMSKYLNVVVENGGTYDLHRFDIGRTVQDFSTVEFSVRAPDAARLDRILENLVSLGCHLQGEAEAILKPSEQDGTVPDDFYSTTNYRTVVRSGGREIEVEQQRMDGCVVVARGRAVCTKLRDVRRGDRIVCGHDGVEVFPPFKERETQDFVFMGSDVSSEKRVEITVAGIARMMRAVREDRGRILAVPGPVVVHTGGGEHLGRLLRAGYIDGVLSGNALAVHDIERALFGTSLGIDLDRGIPVVEGHKNHMRAINAVRRCGSIAAAVEQGVLRSGVMYECVKNGVPFVLAGSIRDDGPMPDTLMDLVRAQEEYARLLRGAGAVLMLGTMLHSIGVGNMIPAWVRTICVDINPAVVTKLSDRGSAQAVGVVTDVGLFLRLLADELCG
ncbi:MAG TPA: TIGR00300 family protein [Candidatus Polarisedimenticolia bacterium]|nr:TIGR00300 family protein [Candidatus Polarisedimenticolia bacterium]